MDEMTTLLSMTPEERAQYRLQCISGLPKRRLDCTPIRDLSQLIHRVEDIAMEIEDLILQQEEQENYSPYLQAMFDDTMDILDYLKNKSLTNDL